VFIVVSLIGCSTSHQGNQGSQGETREDWKSISNGLAMDYTRDYAALYPEAGSSLGMNEYDPHVTQISNDMERGEWTFVKKWKERLEGLLRDEKDPELSTDYAVLLSKVMQLRESLILKEKYNVIPYSYSSKQIFYSLRSRKPGLVDRFKAYVHGENRGRPYIPAFVERTFSFINRKNGEGLYPLKSEVEEYLKESPIYQKGVKDLLIQSGRTDWEKDYKIFLAQVKDADNFLRKSVLPKARTDFHLPDDLYVVSLVSRGVLATPKQLSARARHDFNRTYAHFKIVAKGLAQKYKLQNSDPVSVLKFLKKNQITDIELVREMYLNANKELEEIIRTNDLVSLPSYPLELRFAGDAESHANPVPGLLAPPLLNNKGERPIFVVPTSSDGKLPFDDFAYEPAAIVLSAHEGRPGHDLQFSSMLDNGVSIIRARFAMNPVNIEGWGLYAESIVYPYLSEESKLVALQSRLWRTARAFLEPELQTGKISEDTVIKTFTKDIGVSEIMARLELRRYTYEDPGQAPSYWYGYQRISEAKKEVMNRLGDKFTEKCFNDYVLSLGLLPVNILAGRTAQLICD
jgi:hypothetical protein